MIDDEHAKRIKQELGAAGATRYGMIKLESRYLPRLIHEDEHIGGVAYGRYKGGSAMLIATDHRVIFLDRKPLFTSLDELTYYVVSGVKSESAGVFATVTLHTRIGDYALRFVNLKAAARFVDYIEQRRLDTVNGIAAKRGREQITSNPLTAEAIQFLKEHGIGVLSTLDRTGNVHGAAVYYLVDDQNRVYILTKGGTAKAHNIFAHQQVALTVFEADKMQTLQLSGVAEVEADQQIKDRVFSMIVKPQPYGGEMLLPPVAQLKQGSYMVIRIVPTDARFSDYKRERA